MEDAIARLKSGFDAPLEARDIWGKVDEWTVFGTVDGQTVRARSAGPFRGWSARNGMGIWQPVFAGTVSKSESGTLISGQVGMTGAFLAVFIVCLAWAGSLLVGLLPLVIADTAEGRSGAATAKIGAISLLGLAPVSAMLLAWRAGRREGDALAARLAESVVIAVEGTGGVLRRKPSDPASLESFQRWPLDCAAMRRAPDTRRGAPSALPVDSRG